MCVVSAMGDHYKHEFDPFKKYIPNQPHNPYASPNTDTSDWTKVFISQVTRAEFEELKRQVEEMKKILKVAVEYDKRNNEPHCEIEDKVKLLKEIAKLVGVDLSDVFPTVTSGLIQTNSGDTIRDVVSYNVDLRNVPGVSSHTSNKASL